MEKSATKTRSKIRIVPYRDRIQNWIYKLEMSRQIIISIFILVTCIGKLLDASGVFELELVKLDLHSSLTQRQIRISNDSQQPQHQITLKSANLNFKNLTTVINLASRNQSLHSSTAKATVNSNPTKSNLINVLVCLKEPFTSQVGPPCTFGNASILIHPDQDLKQDSHQSTATTLSSTSNIDQHTTLPDFIDQSQNSEKTGASKGRVLRRTLISMARDQLQEHALDSAVASKHEDNKQASASNDQRPSNLVRINFTFRWMVSRFQNYNEEIHLTYLL